jgi:hypothetical protein
VRAQEDTYRWIAGKWNPVPLINGINLSLEKAKVTVE